MLIETIDNKKQFYDVNCADFASRFARFSDPAFEKLKPAANNAAEGFSLSLGKAVDAFFLKLRKDKYPVALAAKKAELQRDYEARKITMRAYYDEKERLDSSLPGELDVVPYLKEEEAFLGSDPAAKKILTDIAKAMMNVFVDADYISRADLMIENEKGELERTDHPKAQDIYTFINQKIVTMVRKFVPQAELKPLK